MSRFALAVFTFPASLTLQLMILATLLDVWSPPMAHAADLFSSSAYLRTDEAVSCQVINVGRTPLDFIAEVIKFDGTSLAANTCTNIAPGTMCGRYYYNGGGATVVYCKVSAATSAKKLRANLVNINTGSTSEVR